MHSALLNQDMKKLKLVPSSFVISTLYYLFKVQGIHNSVFPHINRRIVLNKERTIITMLCIFLLITLKVDCHEILNRYKQLLPKYFKIFDHIEYVEAYIYKNPKPEKNMKLVLNGNIVIMIIRKPE